MMKLYSSFAFESLFIIGAVVSGAAANADKIIFKGPQPVTYPLAPPSLADLNLDVLGPENRTIRTHLSRIFRHESDPLVTAAEDGAPPGLESWFILDDLTPGQRYELRVCWAAIEPTEFTMSVHELDNVWDTPSLMLSLANYAYARQAEPDDDRTPRVHPRGATSTDERRTSSLLLLQVHAAADYFSHDKTLMSSPPPPVLVDLILDPYIFNVVPQSLLPTAGYIFVVAAATLLLGRWIANAMVSIAADSDDASVSKKKN